VLAQIPSLRTQPSVADLPQAVTRAYRSGRFAVQEGVLLLEPQTSGGVPGYNYCSGWAGETPPAFGAAPQPANPWAAFTILRSTSLPECSSLGLQATRTGAAAAAAAAGSFGAFARGVTGKSSVASSCGELPTLAEDQSGCVGMDCDGSWTASSSPLRSGGTGGSSSSVDSVSSCASGAAAEQAAGLPARSSPSAAIVAATSSSSSASTLLADGAVARDLRSSLRRAASQGGVSLAAAVAAALPCAWEGRKGHTVVFRRGRFLVSSTSSTATGAAA